MHAIREACPSDNDALIELEMRFAPKMDEFSEFARPMGKQAELPI
ncbi:MAG: hypothetical protein WBF66_09565 [Dehalococcoidia bacterium]